MITKTLATAAALAALALSAAPAFADKLDLKKGETAATLAAPLSQPYDDIIDGRFWHCAGVSCSAQPRNEMSGQSYGRECASAASKVGAFASYQTGGHVIDGSALQSCNASARKG